MAESILQRKIIKDLKASGWYVVKIVMSNIPGIPDLWIGKKNRCFWIECKSLGKKIEPLQRHRHDELNQHGFDVFVIDSWEQYLQIKYENL